MLHKQWEGKCLHRLNTVLSLLFFSYFGSVVGWLLFCTVMSCMNPLYRDWLYSVTRSYVILSLLSVCYCNTIVSLSIKAAPSLFLRPRWYTLHFTLTHCINSPSVMCHPSGLSKTQTLHFLTVSRLLEAHSTAWNSFCLFSPIFSCPRTPTGLTVYPGLSACNESCHLMVVGDNPLVKLQFSVLFC